MLEGARTRKSWRSRFTLILTERTAPHQISGAFARLRYHSYDLALMTASDIGDWYRS